MTIGELIKTRRTQLGITLEDVGKAVGVGKSCILKYEKEQIKTLKANKVFPLACVLNVSPIDILKACEESEKMAQKKWDTF